MSEKREIKGVMFYDHWKIPMELLDAERFGKLVKSFLKWAWLGEEPAELDETQIMFFNIAKKISKQDFEKYDAIVEKRREAGRKHSGNQYTRLEQNGTNGTNVPKMEQMEQVGTNGTNNNNNNSNNNNHNNNIEKEYKEKENTADKSATRSQFQKPTIEECFAYCSELGLSTYDYNGQQKSAAQVTAEKFWDYFESNGWKVGGKAAMKDWKSALRNWVRRDAEYNAKGQKSGEQQEREKEFYYQLYDQTK